jgi:hypothetical protein
MTLECISGTTYYFCHNFRYYFFIVWLPFVVVILVAQVLCLLRCRSLMPAPITYFHNYASTALLSVLITGAYCLRNDPHVGLLAAFAMIGIPFILMAQWCCFFAIGGLRCCSGKSHDPLWLTNIMAVKPLSKDDFQLKLATIRRNPPILEISGASVAGAVVSTGHGTRTYHLHQQISEPFPYVSWEERAEPVLLPESELIIVELETKFEYTAELADYAEEGIRRLHDQVRTAMPNCQLWLAPRVEGAEDIIVGSSLGEPSGFQKFAASGCGIAVYVILAIFGLHSVWLSLYCGRCTVIKFQSIKWMSAQPNFHAPAGHPDMMAGTLRRPTAEP